MPTIRKGYVDTADGQIHYLTAAPDAAPDQPPLILLHQNPTSSRMWEAVIPGLAAGGRQVYAFDTPGYGMSNPPPIRPDMPYLARRLVEAAGNLDLGQFDALGHHTGALISAMIAADFPGRVRKLVVSGYPMMSPERRAGNVGRQNRVFTPEADEIAETWRGNRKSFGDCYTPALGTRTMIEKLQAGEWNWAFDVVAAVDHHALALRVPVPALSLCGDQDVSYAGAVEAANVIPGARLTILPGAGGFPADHNPEAYIRAVDEFLKEPAAKPEGAEP